MAKKIILSVFMIVFFTINVFAQGKMIVDQPGGVPYFGSYYKEISSLNQLPPVIVNNVKNLMETFLGDFNSNTHFLYGQVYDLKRYFDSKDSNKMNRSTPKYELAFLLKDPSIGIKSFPIEIRFDENGKPLKVTWPRKGYTNRSKFLSRDTIKAFALTQAAKLNFNPKNYEVDFIYDEDNQKFFWRFLFAINNESGNVRDFDLIEVNWADANDFEISKIRKLTYY